MNDFLVFTTEGLHVLRHFDLKLIARVIWVIDFIKNIRVIIIRVIRVTRTVRDEGYWLLELLELLD
jgi:hypothetical protein